MEVLTNQCNYFSRLYAIDVHDKIEQKNGLNYLSWASAWAEVKKIYPSASYTVYENDIGRYWFDDGHTAWVKTGVTINGLEHIERLPVMDYRNNSIPAENVTSYDANKAVQRSLTKACARHGLGLYIYEGEDLPEETKKKATQKTAAEKERVKELNTEKKKLTALCKSKIEDGVSKDTIYDLIAHHNDGNKNPNAIPDKELCQEIYQLITTLQPETLTTAEKEGE